MERGPLEDDDDDLGSGEHKRQRKDAERADDLFLLEWDEDPFGAILPHRYVACLVSLVCLFFVCVAFRFSLL